MTAREQREMAWLLAEDSEVLDFDTALELVRRRPSDAEKILRMREANRRDREERARVHERLQLALREEFG